MTDADPAIQGLLDDLADTLDVELTALGHERTPYLVLVLPQTGPQICGTITPDGLDAAAKLLTTMAAEMRKRGAAVEPMKPN